MFGYVTFYMKVTGANDVYYGSFEGDFSKPIDEVFCGMLLERFREAYSAYDEVLSVEYCTREEYEQEIEKQDSISASWDERE